MSSKTKPFNIQAAKTSNAWTLVRPAEKSNGVEHTLSISYESSSNGQPERVAIVESREKDRPIGILFPVRGKNIGITDGRLVHTYRVERRPVTAPGFNKDNLNVYLVDFFDADGGLLGSASVRPVLFKPKFENEYTYNHFRAFPRMGASWVGLGDASIIVTEADVRACLQDKKACWSPQVMDVLRVVVYELRMR